LDITCRRRLSQAGKMLKDYQALPDYVSSRPSRPFQLYPAWQENLHEIEIVEICFEINVYI
jgi:hypothetical protein